MSAKSKKSAEAIDRPIDAATMARARKIAEEYQVILACEDGHWYGRGLELPGIHGDGKTVGQCVENTREAFAGWVAYLIEEGQRPPTPARRRPHHAGQRPPDSGRKGVVGSDGQAQGIQRAVRLRAHGGHRSRAIARRP